MTIRQQLIEATEALAAIGAGNPRLEADLLLARALGRPRVYLMTHPDEPLGERVRARFAALLDRRTSSEPLQYVLGDAVFRHLTLQVRPGVLIPRSETEVLVDHAWAALGRWRRRRAAGTLPGRRAARGQKPWVIDVGVGSGAILLSLMIEAARDGGCSSLDDIWFRPLGIDIATVPLALTAATAAANGLPRPALALGDFLSAVGGEAPVAAVVSNPPYIATGEMAELPAEIREYEPHEALHAGPDGLGAIRILLEQSRVHMDRGALLCFEMGATQEAAVRELLRAHGFQDQSTIFPDLAGRPRVVLIEPAVGPGPRARIEPANAPGPPAR